MAEMMLWKWTGTPNLQDVCCLRNVLSGRRRTYSQESADEAQEQGRRLTEGGVEADVAAGSSPAGSDAVRSAMANTRTAELASLAEQADIR